MLVCQLQNKNKAIAKWKRYVILLEGLMVKLRLLYREMTPIM